MAQRISLKRSGGGNGAPIIKWRNQKAGSTYEGKYLGMRKGKFGPLVDFVTSDGEQVTLPAPTALFGQLSQVRKGADISITYNGKVEGQTGRTYHDFDVQADKTDVTPEGLEGVAEPTANDRYIRQPSTESRREEPADEPAPAKKPAAKGRTLKSVFAGLDK